MSKRIFCFALCAMVFALISPAEAQQPGKIFRVGYVTSGTQGSESVNQMGLTIQPDLLARATRIIR